MLRLSAVGRRGLSPALKCFKTHRQFKNSITRTFRTSAIKLSAAGAGQGGGAGSAIAGATLFTIGVGGGVFGYAAFDDKFRKMLEESVPGSQDVFDTILGPLESPPPTKPQKDAVPPPKLKLTSPIMVTKPQEENLEVKEDEAEPTQHASAAPASEISQLPSVEIATPPPPPLEEPPPIPTVVEETHVTVEETPVTVEETPVTVEEIPVAVEETPVSVDEIPVTVEEIPVTTEETPSSVEESLVLEENSAKVEELSVPSEQISTETPSVPVDETSNNLKLSPAAVDEALSSSEETAATAEDIPPASAEEIPAVSAEETQSSSDESSTLTEETSAPTEESSVSSEETLAYVHEPLKEVEKSLKTFPANVENDSLEQVLHELQRDMISATEVAVASLEASADAVVSHIGIMQSVLESNLAARDDNSWNQVFDAATAKSNALKLAEKREKEALAAINNVVESIEAGRRNKTTATNPELLVAEEEVSAALYKLEQGRARIGAVEGEARVVEQYRDIVEEGRQQFNKEMAAIMPDVKLGENNKRLTEDELNMFITHAYRKVLYLQQELAKQQTLEQQRFKQALEKLKIEAQMAASEKMDNELERQKREMEIEHQKRLATMKEDAEAELRIQLRRQAAAHSDHITDVLSVQEAELSRKHEHNLNESLSTAESKYLISLAALNGKVEGLVSALESRSEADKESISAQKLWLACLSLRSSIELGSGNAENLDTTMKPLTDDIKAIKEVAGDCDVVNAIVSGIPEEASNRGVYTETALLHRFNKVESVARKVARIGDEGGSLFVYGMSYLESMLLIDTSERSPIVSNEPVDVSSLDCHAILSEARFSLERGDLVRAVQFMRLLNGEPRRVASDWISEARLHIEAKQASQALIAHAASVGLEVLP